MHAGNPLDAIIAFIAEYFYLVVAALGVLYLLVWHRSRLVGLTVAAAFIGVLGYGLSKLGALLISSPRPFLVTGHPALIPSATDNGFPSDHTLLLCGIAMLITLVNWRVALAFWGMAVLVAWARVYAGVHHMLDVAGSFAIIWIVGVLYLLALRAWNIWRERRGGSGTDHRTRAPL